MEEITDILTQRAITSKLLKDMMEKQPLLFWLTLLWMSVIILLESGIIPKLAKLLIDGEGSKNNETRST